MHDKASLKEAIIDSAYQIVLQQGEKHLTMRKLTQDVGCALGMPYKIFSSLDEIILCINARTLDNLYTKLASAHQHNTTQNLYSSIHTLADAYVTYAKENPALWKMLFNYTINDEHLIPTPDWYVEKVQKLFTLVENTLRENLTSPMEEQELQITAHCLWSSVHGITTLVIGGTFERTPFSDSDKLLASLLSRYLEGINTKH